MSEYVENLYAAAVAPLSWDSSGFAPGATVRTLRDGLGITLILELPPELSSAAQVCSAGQDWFVLEGVIRIGDNTLKPGAYCYYPAGTTRPALRVLERATVLALYSSRPSFQTAIEASRHDIGVTPMIDSWDLQWTDPLSASTPSETFRAGVMVKVLRQDAATGEQVYLAGLMPGWYMVGTEVHGYEENYCLSGDVRIGEVDGSPGYTMTPGCYMSRAPRVPHGPIVTKNGNVNWAHVPGRMVIDYQHHPRADELIRQHLERYPWS